MTAPTFRRHEFNSTQRPFSQFGVYGDELGPFATFCAQAVLFVGFLILFPAVKDIPGKMPYVVLLGAIGVLFLAPRNAVKRIPVSISLIAFLGMMVASLVWTVSVPGTIFDLERLLPVMVAFSILVGLLKFEDLAQGLVWCFRFALLATAVAVVIDPAARAHISVAQYGNEPLPGWHGWYSHKNLMAPLFGVGVMTVLLFDRNQWARRITLTGFAIMIFMSDSRTGLFALVLMLGAWWWLEHFAQLDDRNGVVFLGSTIGLGLLAIIGGLASISAVTNAAGKDASFSGRTDIWIATVESLAERPLLGYGVNGLFWTEPIGPENADLTRRIGFPAAHAHQGILDIVIDVGLIGGALFFVTFYLVFSAAWRMTKTNPKVGMWIVCIMIGQLFMGLSENVLTGGWLGLLVIFRIVTLRRHGMEFPERGQKIRSSWVLTTSASATR